MHATVDVTGDAFLMVEMEFAELWINNPFSLKHDFTIRMRHLIVHSTEDRGGLSDLSHKARFDISKEDVFVSGWATLTIKQPTYIECDAALLDGANGKEFLRDKDGNPITVQHVAGDPEAGIEYPLGGHLLWPQSNCSLIVRALGRAVLRLCVDECVTVREFVADRQRWLEQSAEG